MHGSRRWIQIDHAGRACRCGAWPLDRRSASQGLEPANPVHCKSRLHRLTSFRPSLSVDQLYRGGEWKMLSDNACRWSTQIANFALQQFPLRRLPPRRLLTPNADAMLEHRWLGTFMMIGSRMMGTPARQGGTSLRRSRAACRRQSQTQTPNERPSHSVDRARGLDRSSARWVKSTSGLASAEENIGIPPRLFRFQVA